MNNNKKRLIAGIILLSLGIILLAGTLVIGLKSIIAITLLLLSLTMITVGMTCLFWEKINECLSPCCSQIRSHIVYEHLVDKNRNESRGNSIDPKSKSKYIFKCK